MTADSGIANDSPKIRRTLARQRDNAGPYHAKVRKTGGGDVTLSLAWAKGSEVHRIAGRPSRPPPLAPEYRPRPLLRPAMPPGEFDEFLEVGMLAFARPEEPDRSR